MNNCLGNSYDNNCNNSNWVWVIIIIIVLFCCCGNGIGGIFGNNC
ncbi:MAG: hypothetical protein AB9835_12665 [Eubacteriales bacterium]